MNDQEILRALKKLTAIVEDRIEPEKKTPHITHLPEWESLSKEYSYLYDESHNIQVKLKDFGIELELQVFWDGSCWDGDFVNIIDESKLTKMAKLWYDKIIDNIRHDMCYIFEEEIDKAIEDHKTVKDLEKRREEHVQAVDAFHKKYDGDYDFWSMV